MGGWLCIACGILKRKASSVTKAWDDKTRDVLLQGIVSETVHSVQRDDQAHGFCTLISVQKDKN